MKESKIESIIVDYLIKRGHYALAIENTPYSRYKSKKAVKAIPDILGTTKDGKSLAIEVKTQEHYKHIMGNIDKWLEELNNGRKYGENITRYIDQHFMLQEFNKRGGKALFACSIDDLVRVGL